MSTLIQKFLSLSFPLKFLLGLIFTIIAGPGLLAFLSEYATYLYAINNNIRPPLEGIPYLSASVALISLILSIIAISIFIFTKWIIGIIVSQALKGIKEIFSIIDTMKFEDTSLSHKFKFLKNKPSTLIDISINTLKDLKWKQASLIIFIIPTLLTGMIYGISNLNSFLFNKPIISYELLRIVFIYIMIILLSIWKPIINWLIAIAFAILFYISSFNVLFDTLNYSNYLQVIKYGGDIKILLEYKDTRKKEPVFLALRTRDYIFIKKDKNSAPIEIPLNNVRSITYEKVSKDNKVN